MPAAKRKVDGPTEVTLTKKQRTANALCNEARLIDDQLQNMINADLIKTIKALQTALHESHKQTQALAETTVNKTNQSTAVSWTPQKVTERTLKIRELCAKEIKKQTKRQPSCKKGSTKWSYKGMVPNVDVFRSVFRIEAGPKSFKLRKLGMGEFVTLFGYIQASCRYNDLCITVDHVNLKWGAEESTFQLSGTYGI